MLGFRLLFRTFKLSGSLYEWINGDELDKVAVGLNRWRNHEWVNDWVSQSIMKALQEILAHLKIGMFIYPSYQNELYHTQLLNRHYKIWGFNNRQKLWDNPIKKFSKVVFPRNTVDCVDYVDSVIFTRRRHDHDQMTDTGSTKSFCQYGTGCHNITGPHKNPGIAKNYVEGEKTMLGNASLSQ